MKAINMTKIWKKYMGLWVAMKNTKNSRTVVGSGKTLSEAMDEALKKGYKNPIVQYMSPNLGKPSIGAAFL